EAGDGDQIGHTANQQRSAHGQHDAPDERGGSENDGDGSHGECKRNAGRSVAPPAASACHAASSRFPTKRVAGKRLVKDSLSFAPCRAFSALAASALVAQGTSEG